MSEFLYFSTYIEFKIPINDDGTAGTPVIMSKFTNPMKNKGVGASKSLKKNQRSVTTTKVREAVEL